MDGRDEVRLSRKFRLFQLYSVQVVLGSWSAFGMLSTDTVKEVFILRDAVQLYATLLIGVVIVGTVACVCSGGVGLLRLVNGKRLLKVLEKDDIEKLN